MVLRRYLIAAVALALVAPAVPISADVQYVRCESGAFGRYRECRVKTENRVELVRELSRNRCQQWKSWGYDRDGVWVDRGCRAEFRVGKDGGGIGAGGATAIGVVAGAAVIGAILASKKDHKDEAVGASEWARGRFHGFSPKLETDFDITVARDGKVSGSANTQAISGHLTTNNRMHLGDLEFDIARESWGFAATQKDDRENVIYFRKR